MSGSHKHEQMDVWYVNALVIQLHGDDHYTPFARREAGYESRHDYVVDLLTGLSRPKCLAA